MTEFIFALHMPISPPSTDHAEPATGAADPAGDDVLCQPCGVQDPLHVRDDLGPDATAQSAREIPEVYIPTAAEVARHNLTHMPYRSWCRICVACCKPNTPHRSLPPFSRRLPLVCLDYCFIRDSVDHDLLTFCVVRVYPYRAIAAIPCQVKGDNDYGTARLASFIYACGLPRLTYRCDQESALNTMIQGALNRLNIDGTFAGGVPENSAVGESQSNSYAERSVLEAEI